MTILAAGIDVDWAFKRYESIRSNLPCADFDVSTRHARNLSELADHFDGFILDAFGVLNRGETPIEGAIERIDAFRNSGKQMVVLTNAASYTRSQILSKYRRLGFDFDAGEVVSSRDVALGFLPSLGSDLVWAAAAMREDTFDDATVEIKHLHDDPALLAQAGGFILLSSARWTSRDTDELRQALRNQLRPVVVANPDLVAPRESGLSLEPGAIGHDLCESTGVEPIFCGKPYAAALETAISRFQDLPRNRIAMVGDTLHTDVLGGRAAGIRTILVSEQGLFRGCDVGSYINKSGIRPDWIVSTT